MKDINTNEFIEYKTGFIDGKHKVIELIKLGKMINFEKKDDFKLPLFYEFGYKDGIEFYSNQVFNNKDILNIRIRDVIKDLFIKRVIEYNSENDKELPINKFRIN